MGWNLWQRFQSNTTEEWLAIETHINGNWLKNDMFYSTIFGLYQSFLLFYRI
jgi:hypothetical protein